MDSGISLFNLPDLRHLNFAAHNEESRALWRAFEEGTHNRIPVRFTTNPRVLMLNPAHNTRGINYEQYMTDPELMAQAILEWQYWVRFILPGDQEKGLPDKWTVRVDFQNFYDAVWFGCPVQYRHDQVPDTTPILSEDHRKKLFDRGIPGPFKGEWADRCLQFVDHWSEKSASGWTFLGVPVEVDKSPSPFAGCDGILTVATSLRGTAEICVDLLSDPDYARQLLSFILEAVTTRMKAWREHHGVPVPIDGFCMADDAIELLSVEQYGEFVLPLHERFFNAFGTQSKRSIHLCGDAQRHFRTIHERLGAVAFDTGFPVDFGALRRDLGPDVTISGGPSVPFFIDDDPQPLLEETRRILKSGILEGGRFILQEGNNLPPLANLRACEMFCELGRQLGRREFWT